MLHGSWCTIVFIPGFSGRGFSRPGPSHPSVPPSVGFTHSSSGLDLTGAEITVPHRDGDGCSRTVGANLGCPSPAELGLRTPSSNSVGGSLLGDDHIDASWEILKVLSACGKHSGDTPLDGDSDGRFSAVGSGLGCVLVPSSNRGGDSPPGVDRIDTSWKTLVVLDSNGGDPSACGQNPASSHLDGNSDMRSSAVGSGPGCPSLQLEGRWRLPSRY